MRVATQRRPNPTNPFPPFPLFVIFYLHVGPLDLPDVDGGVDARAHVHHDVGPDDARVARQAVHLHLRAGRACRAVDDLSHVSVGG